MSWRAGSCLHEIFEHRSEMASQGQHRDRGLPAILVHAGEVGLARRSDGTLSVPHCFSGSILYSLSNFVLAVLSRYRTAFPAVSCTHFELRSTGPHEALVRARSRAVIPRAE